MVVLAFTYTGITDKTSH